jgi:cytochrome c oxidase cbb3-type subunit 3
MLNWKYSALYLSLALTPALYMVAQEPAFRPGGPGSADKGIPAAIAGSKEDPAAYERGAKDYTQFCAGCHGATGRGSVGAPDLIRSILVLDDEKGILIAPVLKNGRPDEGMPKLGLTDQQVGDLVAWLHVQTYMAGHRTTYAFQDVLTGDAKKGEAYFNANCKSCHSVTGDLKGVGGRYDALTLQAKWLQPRGGRGGKVSEKSQIMVTVTPKDGRPVQGVLDRIDDFSVSLYDSRGEYHSFTRDGKVPEVDVRDPLKPHLDLLGKITDPDIHNVTAYLASLK